MWMFDTIALSEARKRQANPGFLDWLDRVDPTAVHTSVICLGEIRQGVERLPKGDRRDAFEHWLELELPGELNDRILPLGADAAQRWGRMSAQRSLPFADALIAATALVHGLTVVTRNTRDFDGLGVPVLNPWT